MERKRKRRTKQMTALGLIAVLSCFAGAGAAAQDENIATYVAEYELKFKRFKVGQTQFSVRYDAARDVYAFTSHTVATGVAKLLLHRPIVEYTEFRFDDGTIRPLLYRYEDGRDGDDDIDITFDWQTGIATVDSVDGTTELEIDEGVLDRGSMQVAVIRDVAIGAVPGPYELADEGELETYVFTPEGMDTADIPLGKFETVRYDQTLKTSFRDKLAIWFAPALEHLPVVIEIRKDDKMRFNLTLDSVEFL